MQPQKKAVDNQRPRRKLERAKGIEPSYEAWEAAVLPLNYARNAKDYRSVDDPVDGQERLQFALAAPFGTPH